ncbi:MAG: YceI family protein [Rubrivivax sp.]|nr:YceI family protein [Rubrivivax sp.]
MTPAEARYTWPAALLHALTVPLLLLAVGLGAWMVDLPNGLLRLEAINWHKWAGSVVRLIDMRSIAFGIPETEAEAAKPAWFDSARHPQAQFRSSAVRALGGNRYDVAGTLAIKGARATSPCP